MRAKKLETKYTSKELAESFVFRNRLTPKQKNEANLQLNEIRKRIREKATSEQLLLSRVLQLKYQMEDYANNSPFDINRSFGFFLREYIKALDRKNKDFAREIDIDESELSQILNRHRKPSDKLIIRLEIHSNETIPALTWYRLLEKEKEHEISTDFQLRKKEKNHVKNKLSFSLK
jgi:plasmid maintenance system antidote protein VapI